MEIKELYLKNFGKFTDTHFYLPEKIHVFYGENEYGKTTICAFLKAMLFGMERGRGRAAGKDEFSRYEPWENSNYYAGVMRFTCGGRMFRLERQFDRYSRQTVLLCEDDGEELSVEDGDLEMLLGGMTRSSFENTAAIGRLTAKPGQELSAELKNFAANYYGTGGGTVDLQGTYTSLKEKKRTVEQELKEHRNLRDRRLERLKLQINYVENDAEKMRTELKEKEKELKYEEQSADTYKEKSFRKRLLLCVGVVLMLTGVAGSLWNLENGLAYFGGMGNRLLLFALLFAVGAGCILTAFGRYRTGLRKDFPEEWKRHKRDMPYIREEEKEKAELQQAQSEVIVRKLRWECQRIGEEYQEKKIILGNLQELAEEADRRDDGIRQLESRIQAIDLAIQRLEETAESMTRGFGTRLNTEASEILSAITDGKYSRLLIDEQFFMSVYYQGKRIPVERLSRGTLEQIYFSLRMAALNILYEEEIPVILDDAFVYYDEKRLKSVLKWLSEQPRQVIIFSCQRREEEILKKM